QTQPGFAIRTLARLDQADVGAELLFGHDRPAVGAIVERLVAEAADVEHDADVDRVVARRLRGTRRADEQKADVYGGEDDDERDQLAHGRRCCARGGAGKSVPPGAASFQPCLIARGSSSSAAAWPACTPPGAPPITAKCCC